MGREGKDPGNEVDFGHFGLKVAEHSFQEPMPNSPLLLNYLCFGARFWQESRITTEVFILAFWLRTILFVCLFIYLFICFFIYLFLYYFLGEISYAATLVNPR